MNDPVEQFLVETFGQRVNQLLHLSSSEIFCHNLNSHLDMVGS